MPESGNGINNEGEQSEWEDREWDAKRAYAEEQEWAQKIAESRQRDRAAAAEQAEQKKAAETKAPKPPSKRDTAKDFKKAASDFQKGLRITGACFAVWWLILPPIAAIIYDFHLLFKNRARLKAATKGTKS